MSKLGKIISRALAVIPAAGAPPNDWLSYARFLYPFAISVGAVLAVIMLIIAGLQMMTASESQRTAAKERIQNALLGLLLLIGVFIILKTINPALLDLKINTNSLRIVIVGQGDLPGGVTIVSTEAYSQKVLNDPNSTNIQKDVARAIVNDPNAKNVAVPNKPEEWSALSTSDKIKVFEREAQKCIASGGFGAVVSSDGAFTCRQCAGGTTRVPKPGTPSNSTPTASNCRLNQICAAYSCQ